MPQEEIWSWVKGKTLVVDGLTSSPKVNESFTIAGNATEYTIQSLVNNGSGEYSLTLDKTLAATPSDNAVVTFVKGFLHDVNGIYTAEVVHVVDGNSSVGSFTVSGLDQITLVNAPKATGLKIGFNIKHTWLFAY